MGGRLDSSGYTVPTSLTFSCSSLLSCRYVCDCNQRESVGRKKGNRQRGFSGMHHPRPIEVPPRGLARPPERLVYCLAATSHTNPCVSKCVCVCVAYGCAQ